MATFDLTGPVAGTPSAISTGNGNFGIGGVQQTAPATSTADGSTTPTSTPDSSGANTTVQTSGSLNTVSNGDLPWGMVALPTTSAGQGGLGEGRHGLQPETWVYGTFLDGDACQQPLILGVLSGGPGAGSGRTGGGSEGGGGSTGSSDSGTAPTNAGNVDTSNSGGDNTKKVFEILVKNGYSPQNAAGIVGNLYAEGRKPGTTDINPNQNQIGGGGGYGIAQWTDKGRKAGLMKQAGYNTIEGQTAYLIKELRTRGTLENKAENLLHNARDSVDRSALAFLAFERPRGYNAAYAKAAGGQGYVPSTDLAQTRIKFARQMYAKYGSMTNTNASTSPSSTGMANTPTTPQAPAQASSGPGV